MESFWYGIATREEDYSEAWSNIYWDELEKILPSVKRNKYYWLGLKKLSDCDFCSESLLIQVITECGSEWGQSPTLNAKAQNMADEFKIFFDAVQQSIATADKKTKK